MDFLVEPAFREQFQVSHPTPHYAALLEAVPEEFVGTNARLVPLVHFLCAEVSSDVSGVATSLTAIRSPFNIHRPVFAPNLPPTTFYLNHTPPRHN